MAYKMLTDYDKKGNEVTHPVVENFQNKNVVIESVRVIGDTFYDDHCPCVNVEIRVNGKTYKYADWWLSGEGLKMYLHAECEGKKAEKARRMLVEHIRYHLPSKVNG